MGVQPRSRFLARVRGHVVEVPWWRWWLPVPPKSLRSALNASLSTNPFSHFFSSIELSAFVDSRSLLCHYCLSPDFCSRLSYFSFLFLFYLSALLFILLLSYSVHDDIGRILVEQTCRLNRVIFKFRQTNSEGKYELTNEEGGVEGKRVEKTEGAGEKEEEAEREMRENGFCSRQNSVTLSTRCHCPLPKTLSKIKKEEKM